jgi:hypothetical protein
MRPWLPLALALMLLAGCGENQDGGDPATTSEEAAVLRAIDGASETFARGEYDRTCAHYTKSAQREIAVLVRARTCSQAWAAIDRAMRQSMTPAQFDAVTSYAAESVELDGDSATATYGEPPESAPPGLGTVEGTTVHLRKRNGRWLIASMPSGQIPSS